MSEVNVAEGIRALSQTCVELREQRAFVEEQLAEFERSLVYKYVALVKLLDATQTVHEYDRLRSKCDGFQLALHDFKELRKRMFS